MNAMHSSPPLLAAGTFGALGGIGLASVTALSDRGPLIYWPYLALVIALVCLVQWHRPLPRADRFSVVLTGFMAASLILYLYIVFVDSPTGTSLTMLHHFWRLGFLLSVGSAVSAIATFVTE